MIGKKAFRGKKLLQKVILPKYIKSIGEKAFEICHSLSSINLPKTIKSIGKCGFFSCVSLTEIDLPKGLEVIEDGTFEHCNSLTKIELPKGIKRVGDMAFSYCTALTSISLPNTLLSIGNAFACCGSLEEIRLPSSLMSVGARAFYDCKSLKSVTIESKSVRIGKKAFAECREITTLNLPSSFDRAGTWYFDRFDHRVIVPIALESYDKKTKILKYICSKWDKTLWVLDQIERSDLICALLEKSPLINKETINDMYDKVMDLKSKDYTPEILKYERTHYGNKNELEKTILEIDYYKKAFDFAVIENEIKIIRLKSFEQSFQIPEKIGNRYVTIIESRAFKGCRSLRKLILPSSIKQIHKNAFKNCPNLTIYAQTEEKKTELDEKWNPDNRPVVWNYKK